MQQGCTSLDILQGEDNATPLECQGGNPFRANLFPESFRRFMGNLASWIPIVQGRLQMESERARRDMSKIFSWGSFMSLCDTRKA